jgi:hypothetical protein
VVAVSQALRENMVAEGKCTNACFLNILSLLSTLQLVRSMPCCLQRKLAHGCRGHDRAASCQLLCIQ